MPRLNPVVSVSGRRYVFAPQFLATMPVAELGQSIAWLRDDDHVIARSLDLILGGG